MKILNLVDSFGIFFRLFHAAPNLKNTNGDFSGMINGFVNFISNLQSDFESDYVIFALDSPGKKQRHNIFENYKANRQSPPPALLEQLPICIDIIKKMGFCSISLDGYEADDIIASVVKKLENEDVFIKILSSDKDLYQLISNKVSICDPIKKIIYNSDACFEKFGVKPGQICDFLSIVGDVSDNIPGVKGIGDKGAKKLLQDFDNLENIYKNLEKISNKRTQQLLQESKENAFLSQKLIKLYSNLDFDLNLERAIIINENPISKIPEILDKYELNRLKFKLEKKSENIFENIFENNKQEEMQNLNFKSNLILKEEELKSILKNIDENIIIAFDTETTGLDVKIDEIVGFSFCIDGLNAYYVPLRHRYINAPNQISIKMAKWAIDQIFKATVIGHNLKFDFGIIKTNFDINPPKKFIDTMILAWLSYPGNPVGMDSLAKKLFNHQTIEYKEIVPKNENFSSVNVEIASKYASEDAFITFKFYKYFLENLDKTTMRIANEIEFKFLLCLYEMQFYGIEINIDKLELLIKKNSVLLSEMTQKIYDLSGENFNINSSMQLSEILFNKLKLPAKKKNTRAFSTDEKVLKDLINVHPIIQEILNYRELYKLQSTYCEPILKFAKQDKQNKIYTSFLQTGTSTGRLSSKNPNLQNIPARGKLAKYMREIFIPSKNHSLIGLDYSQIELRLLAHFSKDPALLDAFNKGLDIHSITAQNIFGSSDNKFRNIAKSINFGLIYGMGAYKLANQLNITNGEAANYIKKYFENFATIKDFLNQIKENAQNDGFVSSLLGRKRYFDFKNARGMNLSALLREAVNTKFQGSAADIIKLSMISLKDFKEAKMLLQIHDELIFEVPDEIANEFGQKAKEIMQNIYKLNVPLQVSLNIGKTWADLK